MSEVLASLTARYTPRPRTAVTVAAVNPPAVATRRATRTYTGEALLKRQQWGQQWGQIGRQAAQALHASKET